MKYLRRHLEKLVMEINKEWPVILITGARQSGKTTMLKKLAEEEGIGREYISLDDLTAREMAKNDPKMFLELHKPPVFIDEIQYAPELFTYIKIYVDEHHHSGDFWLTGSQIFRLMRGVQESLAGRVALLHMSPLSQREMIGAKGVPFTPDFKKLVEETKKIKKVTTPNMFVRIWNGCMPGLFNQKFAQREIFYDSYISTYIEREVREISGTIDALKFANFIRSVAARTGQQVNYKAIADDADIDQVVCKKWINILETFGIIFLLYPYSHNVLKRTIKTPKLYFYDTGLVCYLTRWSCPEVAEAGAMNGALLENFTVSEIIKSYRNAGKEPFVHYYRDKDTKEIDLILEKDGKLSPLEIKKTTSPDKRIVRNFNVLKHPPLELGTSAVLCMADGLGAFDKDNLIVPIWLI